jgi:hypothetical protein
VIAFTDDDRHVCPDYIDRAAAMFDDAAIGYGGG